MSPRSFIAAAPPGARLAAPRSGAPPARCRHVAAIAAAIAAGCAPAAGAGDGAPADPGELTPVAGTWCPDAPLPAVRPPDGSPVPPDRAPAVRAATVELDAALLAQDPIAIGRAVCAGRRALGPWQGVAEAPAQYGTRDAVAADPRALAAGYLAAVAQRRGSEPWVVIGGSTDGRDSAVAPRATCDLAVAYLAAARLPGADAAALTAAAVAGLDWVLAIQRPDGLIPFPDLSDDYERCVASCVAAGGARARCADEECPTRERLGWLAHRAKAAWEASGRPIGDLVVGGWMVRDHDPRDGGLQFDHGTCGTALVRAARETGLPRYRDAARRAGEWARAQRAVTNWNYNAFSVLLLATLADAEPAGPWAQAALERARIGLLPGALPDGRWADPHNARIVYHQIITWALAALDRVVDDAWLAATLRAARLRTEGELTERGSTAESWAIEAELAAEAAGMPPSRALRIAIQGAHEGGQVDTVTLVHWIRRELARP